jgi:PAS domain S-box-containing protein
MFTGTNNRARWLAAMPATVAFAAFAVFIGAMTDGGSAIQIVAAGVTVGGVFLHYLAIENVRVRDRGRMLALLRLLNRAGDMPLLMKEITAFMKSWTGCRAVGIRLQDGDDFPYFETRGFSEEFVQAERHLCVRDQDGQSTCDSTGDPVLECMCGNVIRGRIDPSKPFFTAKGTFFTNSTTRLLASTSEKDRQSRTRNRCNGEGYESVALIPLKSGDRTFGLLQFNDRRRRRFPARRIRFLEEIADVIALSIGQRNAQALLAQKEAQYRQIVETADEGIVTLDSAGKIVYLNARSAAIFGIAPDAAKGRMIEEFFSAEDLPEQRERDRQARAGGPHKFEIRVRRSDGSQVWCLWSTRPNLGDKGEYLGCFAMISDITERKQAEAEREQLQSQLLQAQKLESIGRLAGGVAHDFNNMLSVINGHAEMALEQIPVSEPLHEDLWNILNAGRRSAALTRQLLAFARQQTIQPRVINLNKVVSSMLKLLRRLIGENIELVWSPAPSLWHVRIDPAQIDQILANLAVNARDAIAGVGKVCLATSNHELTASECPAVSGAMPGPYVRLTFSDTGCGMDKETVEHIFEPFFTTKKAGEGTGLGLATVYGVVRQNHGFISVNSEHGKGTAFNIYIPRCDSAVTTTSEMDSLSEARAGHETLLVVEDEEAVLSLVRERLCDAGYTVIAANTPEEAIRLAVEHDGEIDLLVTDLVMPGMNGRELSRRLLEARPKLKCLFMSGYPADVAVNHGIVEAGLHLVQKPFGLRVLAKTVREILDEGPQGTTRGDRPA